ncbi:transport permease protein [Nocardiopsis terrae]|uniref:ABC-2 type transport system permease protein n=1 Tax=Nocardiopsis terrae TaxID=372655 RepID=A0ABR9HAF0_9ACTN|nr:ABC transporter permease [Nocardiopsis terrae]MBE1455995.1 ABC-2 type transport system permease protein [Nocardiopsis terrae]GHC96341.1 transport permease protein [Nocardiopsis terrae]
MTTTTTPAPVRGAARTRTAPGWFRQTLRLTRTEFTLFVRYKTAWLYLVMPLVLFMPLTSVPSTPAFGDFTTRDLSFAAAVLGIGLMLGIGHPSNVFAARRESLVLKRLRVSGVPQVAIFGGVVALVVLFTLLLAALVIAVGGRVPADPVLMLVAVLLGAAAMSLVGLLITPLVRNAESAQMFSMVPMLALLLTGGVFFPLDLLPEPVRMVAQFLPVAPTAEMAQAAYTGYDVFGGVEGAEAVGTAALWTGALPAIGVMLAWIVVLALLVHRYFKWDPRQP